MSADRRVDLSRTVGHCSAPGCGKPMLSKWGWEQGVRVEGHVKIGSRAMSTCHACTKRFNNHGSFERRVPRGGRGVLGGRNRTNAELVEDYLTIRPGCKSLGEAARRLDISEEGLAKALRKAYAGGVTEAVPPTPQIERAYERGLRTYYREAC